MSNAALRLIMMMILMFIVHNGRFAVTESIIQSNGTLIQRPLNKSSMQFFQSFPILVTGLNKSGNA